MELSTHEFQRHDSPLNTDEILPAGAALPGRGAPLSRQAGREVGDAEEAAPVSTRQQGAPRLAASWPRATSLVALLLISGCISGCGGGSTAPSETGTASGSPPAENVDSVVRSALPQGERRILGLVSRRGTNPAGPQPIPQSCLGVPVRGFTILGFLVSTIARDGARVSGSSEDLIQQAGVFGAVRFYIEGTISGSTLQLNIRAEPPEFGHREQWTATLKFEGGVGVVEGLSSGTFMLNECTAMWSGEPFVAQIRPWTQSPPVGGTVVVNEFRTRGPAGANDEFVEIRNDAGAAISIGGWRIDVSSGSGSVETRHTFPNGTVIEPGCHYLLAGAAAGGYTGAVSADATYSGGIADDGGIAVRQPDGTIVDAVGMNTGSAFKEGQPLASFGGDNTDRSYQRLIDTNDNRSDFTMNAPSSPINRAGSCSIR